MIESIELENFQAHRRLRFELSPAVTTIIGPSDRGKSAVLRALRWVFLNQPAGDAFIRRGAKGAKVTVRVDGHEIVRSKTSGLENAYRLDGKRFVAFGAQVPGELSLLLGASGLNFQGQHAAPFWFGETPGEVGRQLNAIVDLSAIDATLAYLDREVRKAGARADVGRERAATAKAARAATAKAEEMDTALRAVEALERGWAEIERNRGRIAVLVKNVSEYREEAEAALKRRETALAAFRLSGRWERISGKAKKLGDLVTKIAKLQSTVASCKLQARTAAKELKGFEGKRCPVCQRIIPSSRS